MAGKPELVFVSAGQAMYLQIPEQHISGVEKIIAVENEAIAALQLAFQELPPSLDPVFKVSEIASKTGKINRETASEIAALIFSLYSLTKDEYITAAKAASSLRESVNEDERFSNLTDKDLDNLEKRLNILLGSDSTLGTLEISRKALDLIAENERLYINSKILTDIRPVFDSATEEQLDTAIVVHTLRILYRDMQGVKEFYVAISSEDLDDLHGQIVVALENRKAIRSVLQKARINFIMSSSALEEELEEDNDGP
jgi:hypothetical protein